MAAACYEKEVSIESINSHSLGPNAHHHFHHHSHHHHHHHRSGNVGTGNSSSTTSSSTPVSSGNRSSISGVTVIGQGIVSPTVANDIVIAGGSTYKGEPTPVGNFKDYAQPLHVDCSVEYELPSQAKPPPGGGEPLLMIHPCYYRRAERERRSPFVNNLPPMVASSGRKTSRRDNSVSQSHVAKGMTGGDAASVAMAVVATATAAVTSSAHTNANSTILLGDALTASSPSTIAINTLMHRKQTRRDDDCNNQDNEIDKKRLSQQHRAAAFSTVPNAGNLTTADEKAVISGIYQHYFRAMRSHHQPHHHHLHQDVDQGHTQVPQQHHHLYEDAHLHVNTATALTAASPAPASFIQNFQMPADPVSTTSSRRRTTNQHHPYRRGCSISRAPTAAIPTIPSSPSSSVYATAMNRHREASLQALRMAAAAVAAAAAAATGGSTNNGTTGSFYEAPAYRALLPRS
ncbi:midnolin homolog [Diachasma alloeum]|uniref:midnolin homolog n=1 Tax=Diachasma alloeum TaxID=454923 RepID=UPI00073815C9|nr:midnolin homolog [Diachasma alloeum]